MKRTGTAAFFFCIIFASIGCRNGKQAEGDDKVIAKTEGHTLYWSDYKKNAGIYLSADNDSLASLYSYAERWCRDMVFLEEAVRNTGSSAMIEELVDAYRKSLYADAYEKAITGESKDTTVSEAELTQYYQEKRGEYKLDGPIVKIIFAVFKKDDLDEKTFLPLWKDAGTSASPLLQKYCSDHAEDFRLNGDKWQRWSEVGMALPSGLIDIGKLNKKSQQTFKHKDLIYFVKVNDLVKSNEDPPLSFVRDQAVKSILHIRKQRLLESKKKELYEIAVKNKTVNILVK